MNITQILSIGKSIKIIRFIESENKSMKQPVSLPTDFYARYKAQLSKLVHNPHLLVDSTSTLLASR